MLDEQDIRDLKAKVEKARRDADRADGVRTRALKELKEKYGVSTLEKAKQLLSKEEKDLNALEKKLEEEADKLEEVLDERGEGS